MDLTEELRETAETLFELRWTRSEELAAVQGEQAFAERQTQLERMLSALDQGLLERSLFVAV